ncbi:hypothetical protein MLD38_010849 [Melastoma candidum]|uniref:Uncharacterized protein n=1 Tax=Melastoma candidum TaxID=119954 RepID=A0ACB9R0P2_9MYRT|nr:hypothetical protein MLD38_010849 [Melastoma candidum]
MDSLDDFFSASHAPIFILTLIVLFLWWKLKATSSRSAPPLPPGPWPLPVVGNIPSLHPNLHVYFTQLSASYGPIFKLHLGAKLTVVVSSPSAARAILKDNDLNFANRDPPFTAKAATYGATDILWRPYGPEWRELRKVCTVKMLSNANLDSVYELRRMEVRKCVRFVYERAGSEVRLGESIISTLTNVITNMIIGGTMKGDEREVAGKKIIDVLGKMIDVIATPDVSDFFPVLARFDLQGLTKRMKVLIERNDKLLDMIIEKAMASVRDRIDGGTDFVQYLLRLREEEDIKASLTNTQIKALFIDMMNKMPLVLIPSPRLSNPGLYD